MPKKKSMSNDEPLMSRPQRNMRAKIVFDPSDNYLPKRRNKKLHDKKKNSDSKSKHSLNNELSIIDSSSNDIITISPVPSPSTSPVRLNAPEIFQEESPICCICLRNTPKRDFIDCAICSIKTHKDCLIVTEPMWKFKLDTGPWLCLQCRKQHCSKCLENELKSKILCSCVTCKVGLHLHCYESFEIKPLHSIKSDVFICIPCMTLATQRIPEIDEDEDLVNTHSASISLITSDDEDQDINSIKSYNSSIGSLKNRKNSSATPKENIPDITTWDKYEVYDYLSQRLPLIITKKILENEIDGCALKLLKRTDITLNMNLALGHAMHLYKEVRILQTQSTFPAVYWE